MSLSLDESDLQHEIAELFERTNAVELANFLALLSENYNLHASTEREDLANINSLVLLLTTHFFKLQILLNKADTQKHVLIDGNNQPCTHN